MPTISLASQRHKRQICCLYPDRYCRGRRQIMLASPTCTVALGSQARGMKKRSFMLKLVPNTARNATKHRTASPMHSTATPSPANTNITVISVSPIPNELKTETVIKENKPSNILSWGETISQNLQSTGLFKSTLCLVNVKVLWKCLNSHSYNYRRINIPLHNSLSQSPTVLR